MSRVKDVIKLCVEHNLGYYLDGVNYGVSDIPGLKELLNNGRGYLEYLLYINDSYNRGGQPVVQPDYESVHEQTVECILSGNYTTINEILEITTKESKSAKRRFVSANMNMFGYYPENRLYISATEYIMYENGIIYLKSYDDYNGFIVCTRLDECNEEEYKYPNSMFDKIKKPIHKKLLCGAKKLIQLAGYTLEDDEDSLQDFERKVAISFHTIKEY